MIKRNSPEGEKTGRKEFTLIELLIVVAIISILAALLLPALGRARKTAGITKCLSNLKQIGTTLVLYADSYKEWSVAYSRFYPITTTDSQWFWFFTKTPYSNTPIRAAMYTGIDLGRSRGSVLYCNAAVDTMKARGYTVNDSYNTYGINRHLINTGNRGRYDWVKDADNGFFKPYTVPLPSRLFWAQCASGSDTNDYMFTHDLKVHPLLFVDLSARTLRRGDFARQVAGTYGRLNSVWNYYPANGSPYPSYY